MSFGAAGGKADDDAHRPRRIGLRPREARHGRERGSTRCQMQKLAAAEVSWRSSSGPELARCAGLGAGPVPRASAENDSGCGHTRIMLLSDDIISILAMGAAMQLSDRIGRRMKLQDLHVLMTVVQAGSMGKAAQLLNTTQPAISRSIAELEHALGVRLLDRHRQGVEPTEYGRALLDCGAAVFDDLRQGVKNIEFLADPRLGKCGSEAPPFWPRASFPPSSIGSPGAIRASCFIS